MQPNRFISSKTKWYARKIANPVTNIRYFQKNAYKAMRSISPSNLLFYRKKCIQGLYLASYTEGLQSGLSGRGALFVDIKLKVPPQPKLLRLKCCSYCNVNKRLSSTRWTTLYITWAAHLESHSSLALEMGGGALSCPMGLCHGQD